MHVMQEEGLSHSGSLPATSIPGVPTVIPAKAGIWTRDPMASAAMGYGIRRHSRVGGNLDARYCGISRCARSYDVSPAVRARRIVEPAAMSRPPARKRSSSRPPDTPVPPALGSSSGGMGVGVRVAVAVGTGVRVGVIVGGGVGVGVLVFTMSYEPATGSAVARGVGVRVGGAVACGVPACAVACGVPACAVACGVSVCGVAV